MMRSCENSPRCTSPERLPSHITMMRSQTPISSGISGRNHDNGLALLYQLAEQQVNIALGADIDAAGRLIEDDDIRVVQQPLGDNDLLLVAAGQVARNLVAGRSFDVQLFDVLHGSGACLVLVVKAVAEQLFDGYHGDIVVYRAAEVQTSDFSVLSDEGPLPP